jgi:hypothetical protein
LVNNKQGLGRFWKNNDFVVVDLYLVHINPSATQTAVPQLRHPRDPSRSPSLPLCPPARRCACSKAQATDRILLGSYEGFCKVVTVLWFFAKVLKKLVSDCLK